MLTALLIRWLGGRVEPKVLFQVYLLPRAGEGVLVGIAASKIKNFIADEHTPPVSVFICGNAALVKVK